MATGSPAPAFAGICIFSVASVAADSARRLTWVNAGAGKDSLYRLSTPQFHSLYAGEVSDETLALLFSAVENGDQNCIDLL
ncbi:hypothetical protein ONJ17_25770, partial [Salmonella enterica subsp. enterica serovar Agona]|nr:hypothetical protein [Salmonella enterica subsp. enterica serovar Agona]